MERGGSGGVQWLYDLGEAGEGKSVDRRLLGEKVRGEWSGEGRGIRRGKSASQVESELFRRDVIRRQFILRVIE